MPLVAGDPSCTTGLSKRIRDEILANVDSAIDGDQLRALAHAIAVAVVDEIQANATVLPTLLVAPGGGGPVTGTGTVT